MNSSIRRARVLTAMGTIAILSGCSTGLESLPLGAPSVGGGTYRLTAVFVNALNLPAHAKVKISGTDVGEVDTIQARDFTAHVTMRIRSDISVYAGATAELRSATPLGDLFVAIRSDHGTTPNALPLADGAAIPLSDTSAGATVEELLSSAAVLVNGGVVRSLTHILNGAGSAVGDSGAKIAELLRQSNELVRRLNARSAQIKDALGQTSKLAAAVSVRQDTINNALSAADPAIAAIADNKDQILTLIDAVARVTRQLLRFPSLQGTDTRGLIADINAVSKAFNDASVDPATSLTSFNRVIPRVLKLTSGANLHASGDVEQLVLGALPDMNYPGDPMAHGPDGTDWHAMIGSLRYQWNLLLNRIYGPNR
ncbi:MCE family lipoprotein Mce6E [Mycobacteroides abscessus subsp. abscessus]|nr:MCE family lipoprotein Mce6E [Mycobacteroides abscessus subsp. abscessus]SKK08724.1 MCE family lipoprotein Mce6E [Mycobacteroides abscessus subsp. bolletii]SKT69434.1 MCE family lipoprotein Mce6E [Mycobacteroides abscessus subsp. massiliense]SHX41519.1 MCE family lipoprotein Mce6E [Mycobacteroides abscessus subsp. abscessus]SIG57274.1 MCE family lipoprotein Mce6E [Mycobacteroides abscessus subsp. abscessus]